MKTLITTTTTSTTTAMKPVKYECKIYPFVRTEEGCGGHIKNAQGWTALVVFTMADHVAQIIHRMCELANVQYVDLLRDPHVRCHDGFFQSNLSA
jgi:hypothetical protein